MSHCELVNNQNQGSGGGAIFNFGSLKATNVIIMNNESKNNGGGIYNYYPNSIDLVNVLIAQNKSVNGYGGGLYNNGIAIVTNCTLAENSAQIGGGAFAGNSTDAASTTLNNTIIWGNTAVNHTPHFYNWAPATYSVNYSIIENMKGGTSVDGTLGDNAARFAYTYDSSLTGPMRYALHPSSKAIDKGDNSRFPAGRSDFDNSGVDIDLAGNARIYNKATGGIIDLGVFEYPTMRPTAEFVEDNAVCEGNSGSLKVKLTGFAPWNVTYEVVGSNPVVQRTVVITTVDANHHAVLTGLPTAGGTTEYKLTAVSQGVAGSEIVGGIINKETAKISVVSNPHVSAIEGPSEVGIGKSIRLTNSTSGGTWMISNPAIATIDLRGNVTGVAEGTVEAWYVVTGAAPTYCETIVTHLVTVKKDGGGGDNPDPKPDPKPDPVPDPEGMIVIQPGTNACYTDEYFNIVYKIEYKDKPMRYAIAFNEEAKAAGFVDITTLQPLPSDEVITVAIPHGVKPGKYAGEVLILEEGGNEYKKFPFTVTIKDGVAITAQPQSLTNQTGGELFTLSVTASGDNLTYQWFYNGEKIEGATSSTYSATYDGSREGLYHVEVYGDCGWIESDRVQVSGCFTVLLKWDDVLYVDNTAGKFVKFQWYKDGEAITTHGTSVYYTNPSGMNGTYSVRAYYADGTYLEGCGLTLFVCPSAVNVYPTVVERNSYIHVESDEIGESYVGSLIEVYNLSGQRIYAGRMDSPRVEVPMTRGAGAYILQVTAPNGKRKTEKVIVK